MTAVWMWLENYYKLLGKEVYNFKAHYAIRCRRAWVEEKLRGLKQTKEYG